MNLICNIYSIDCARMNKMRLLCIDAAYIYIHLEWILMSLQAHSHSSHSIHVPLKRKFEKLFCMSITIHFVTLRLQTSSLIYSTTAVTFPSFNVSLPVNIARPLP